MVSVNESYSVDLNPGISALDRLSLQFQTSERELSCKGDTSCTVAHLVVQGEQVDLEGGWDLDSLEAAGFTAKLGQTLALPNPSGAKSVLVGLGVREDLDEDAYREAGAAFTRCVGKSGKKW